MPLRCPCLHLHQHNLSLAEQQLMDFKIRTLTRTTLGEKRKLRKGKKEKWAVGLDLLSGKSCVATLTAEYIFLKIF